jgi:hypothetical protein
MLPYTAADITEMVTDQYSCSNTRDTVQQGPKQLQKQQGANESQYTSDPSEHGLEIEGASVPITSSTCPLGP